MSDYKIKDGRSGTITMNENNLPNGIYLYEVNGEIIVSEKLVIIK